MQAVADIARTLIQVYEAHEGKDVNLNALRGQVSRKYRLKTIPPLTAIIAAIPEHYKKYILPKLITKPIRTSSGIAVVAVMCKPHRCPHIAYTGNICVYCPGGPDSDFECSTQSYTGYEPASMRAIRSRYDPFEQARGRVDQLRSLGHSVDKVEYIIMGGTSCPFLNPTGTGLSRNSTMLFQATLPLTSTKLYNSLNYPKQNASG